MHKLFVTFFVTLFNNDLNSKAQLIFSTHDLLLMDLKTMFRKDQIYLTNINNETNDSYVIHLSDISSRDENGIRGDEDIIQYYLHGKFGAIPSPDLFDLLEEAINDW